MRDRVSIIVPTYRGSKYIPYLLRSLLKQTYKEFEVVFVIKPSDDGTEELVSMMSRKFGLRCKILIQRNGHFTYGLNLGKKYANGDVLLYTDDDVILPKDWVMHHLKAHSKYKYAGAISGRVMYYNLGSSGGARCVQPSEDEEPLVRIYRRLLRPIVDRPHELFKEYRYGVYITKDFKVAHGYYIPYKFCFSLPYRGVNMSFKAEAIKNAHFPEYPLLKRAPFNEQYVGAQVALRGWKSFYMPHIVVYHISRESLSRPKNKKDLISETHLMMRLLKELLGIQE